MSVKMDTSIIAHFLILAIVLILVALIIYPTFDLFSFSLALGLSILIILAHPKLPDRLETQSAIQYYVVIIILTVFFSVQICKDNRDLILVLVLTAGVTLLSLYLGKKELMYLAVFLNSYLLIRVGKLLWDGKCDC